MSARLLSGIAVFGLAIACGNSITPSTTVNTDGTAVFEGEVDSCCDGGGWRACTTVNTDGAAVFEGEVDSCCDGDGWRVVRDNLSAFSQGQDFKITGNFNVDAGSTIHGGAISNFAGPDNLVEIAGDLRITGSELSTISGFGQLQRVGGNIILGADRRNLDFLSNIADVGGNFFIPRRTGDEISGVNRLACIGGNLVVQKTFWLTSLSGFNRLGRLGGELIIVDNPHLTDLSGLTSLASAAKITIANNPSLTPKERTRFVKRVRANGYKGEIVTAL